MVYATEAEILYMYTDYCVFVCLSMCVCMCPCVHVLICMCMQVTGAEDEICKDKICYDILWKCITFWLGLLKNNS